ncbi:MAG: cation:proton antiporter [Gammaproteobacteria bacterium]|nr:cation:proton antiporter [Gammaproteobacteria bacterium]
MTHNAIVYAIFLIFAGAAIFSTLALWTKQSLLVAYMVLGVVLGPWGFKLIDNIHVVHKIGDIGIIFLLFLLGLNLHPQDLFNMFKKTFVITLLSSLMFWAAGFFVAYMFNFSMLESFLIGIAMVFSSTIIGLKLLPTTVLHHQHTGELVISILLLQDMLAILALFFIHVMTINTISVLDVVKIFLGLPVLVLLAFFFFKFVLKFLFRKFDKIHEYLFLLSIAWCLAVAELASFFGFSYEIGGFVAGVAIAASPISLYIAESLKPVRDFFMVLFFFSIGASFNLHYFGAVIVPAVALSLLLVILKPFIFRTLLFYQKENSKIAWEVGVRLGQASSFSILVAYVAEQHHLIGAQASYLIQATTMLTFVVSSYLVVWFYPTPMSFSKELRRD